MRSSRRSWNEWAIAGDFEKKTGKALTFCLLFTFAVTYYRSVQEAAGFGENGEDLANAGGALYLAFVPFLVFGLYYIFGNGPNPYSSSGGNF